MKTINNKLHGETSKKKKMQGEKRHNYISCRSDVQLQWKGNRAINYYLTISKAQAGVNSCSRFKNMEYYVISALINNVNIEIYFWLTSI